VLGTESLPLALFLHLHPPIVIQNNMECNEITRGCFDGLSLFAPHKYVGMSTLCYKLSVNLLVGNLALVWIQGPYPAGKYTNIHIFSKFYLTPSTPLDPHRMNGPKLTTIAGMQTKRCLKRCSTCGESSHAGLLWMA